MTVRISVALLASGLLLAVASASAQVAYRAPSNTRPVVNGTFADAEGGEGAFSGSIRLEQFKAQSAGVLVIGTLTGALVDSSGKPLGRIDQEITLPLTRASSTCDLLQVEFGPGDLDLLDLRVHLQKDVLGITAKDGPPRDALCSLARLFDSRPKPGEVATGLNQVLHLMVSSR